MFPVEFRHPAWQSTERKREVFMSVSLAQWNAGMDDAEAGSLARPGMPPDYYLGYEYACALNYEYMGLRPEPRPFRAPTAERSLRIPSPTEPFQAPARAAA